MSTEWEFGRKCALTSKRLHRAGLFQQISGAVLATMLVAGSLLCTSATSQAKVVERWRTGYWTGEADVDDASGAFELCLAQATYRNGLTLSIQVDGGYNWFIGLSASSWKLRLKSRIPISYRLQEGKWEKGFAVVVRPDMARLPMLPDSFLSDHMQTADAFFIDDGQQVYDFRLQDMAALMARLQRCVDFNGAGLQDNLGAVDASPTGPAAPLPAPGQVSGPASAQAPATPASVNPAASAAVAPAEGPAINTRDPETPEQLAAEATDLLRRFENIAGLRGFTLTPEARRTAEFKGVHAVASGEKRILAAHIFPEFRSSKAVSLMSAMISDSAKKCEGSFSSGSEQRSFGGISLLSGYSTCDSNKLTLNERYAIMPRKEGGVFVVSVTDSTIKSRGQESGPTPFSDTQLYSALAEAAQ